MNIPIAIARLKKPHRHFLAGDLVVGMEMDGNAESLVCWGWSSKHRRVVGGLYGYRLRYWRSGHIRILTWKTGPLLRERSPQPRDEAWLRRLLSELSCGNLPLSRKEAASSERIQTP